ncbi:uncharacterized protein LOC124453176 [Xenia sp. Carnegie-2017]|uniref:uncharacterized protein LOC124453176 n=1 Tax=Xenia sp. Carnegie-2017 TaxID=2897299 RepID=UPI001F03BA7C|nr:uncharacterized protein LOC124453176 [Xenia sp. Carnegie-2017]
MLRVNGKVTFTNCIFMLFILIVGASDSSKENTLLRNPLASSLVTTSIPNQIPNCPSKLVLSGVRLKHGRKLALFTLRARVESVMKCIEKCCEKDWCNLAYKVGAYCYSVQCPDVEACEASKGPGMEISEYILLDRPYTGNYRRSFIHADPATQEKIVSITLNITNEKYRPALDDIESLDFLNVAERVENAISNLLKNADGFRNCEVLTFRPGPLLANITLRIYAQSSANQSATLLLQAINAGKMDSTLEDGSEHFTLSQEGFDVKIYNNHSIVCHGEFDYQTEWGLTIYGRVDAAPCPRGGQGECTRRCLGDEDNTVKWDVPNFSECTSYEFRDLHEKSKQFKTEAEKKIPLDEIEAKVGMKHYDFFKKLQRLTLHHTFYGNDFDLSERNVAYNNAIHNSRKDHGKFHDSRKTQGMSMSKSNRQAKVAPKTSGVISLTNELLNSNDLLDDKNLEKIDSSLSFGNKIGHMQPGTLIKKKTGASQYVLNQSHASLFHNEDNTLFHGASKTQHAPIYSRHSNSSLIYTPSRNTSSMYESVSKNAGAPQYLNKSVITYSQKRSNSLQRDTNIAMAKAFDKNNTPVSVKVTGNFGQLDLNDTDFNRVFVKSIPEIIRSRVPRPSSQNSGIGIVEQQGLVKLHQTDNQQKVTMPSPKKPFKSTYPSSSAKNILMNWLNSGKRVSRKFATSPQRKTSISRSQSHILSPLLQPRLLDRVARSINRMDRYNKGQHRVDSIRALFKRALKSWQVVQSQIDESKWKRQIGTENYYTASDYDSRNDPEYPFYNTYPASYQTNNDKLRNPETGQNSGRHQGSVSRQAVDIKRANFFNTKETNNNPYSSIDTPSSSVPRKMVPYSQYDLSDTSRSFSNYFDSSTRSSSPSSYEDNSPPRPLSPLPNSLPKQPRERSGVFRPFSNDYYSWQHSRSSTISTRKPPSFRQSATDFYSSISRPQNPSPSRYLSDPLYAFSPPNPLPSLSTRPPRSSYPSYPSPPTSYPTSQTYPSPPTSYPTSPAYPSPPTSYPTSPTYPSPPHHTLLHQHILHHPHHTLLHRHILCHLHHTLLHLHILHHPHHTLLHQHILHHPHHTLLHRHILHHPHHTLLHQHFLHRHLDTFLQQLVILTTLLIIHLNSTHHSPTPVKYPQTKHKMPQCCNLTQPIILEAFCLLIKELIHITIIRHLITCLQVTISLHLQTTIHRLPLKHHPLCHKPLMYRV